MAEEPSIGVALQEQECAPESIEEIGEEEAQEGATGEGAGGGEERNLRCRNSRLRQEEILRRLRRDTAQGQGRGHAGMQCQQGKRKRQGRSRRK